ncbi:triple tyrosine motif-containing protein [Pedobacter sp. KR3-3]|uniref:Triple tyrosine motif-containing protein n=1 Tax=Pedobacter albus TaxID=3113905 RepID=A0ABU7ICH7_9SPHI|nr:triple tyrosine motif-containing protein [Pedobacter sp. KR3-3]MEE1947198.1 triple tyrosine motif-containing protein [Pedobacter sp. KR3-3]
MLIKNKPFLYLFVSCCLCLFSASLWANGIQSIGVPYVQNYPKSAYLSGNQNWSIAKDKTGLVYFGNAEGLLVYDGKYWQQYKMPNRQIVRSVATSSDGRIYSGSFGEFGYWSYQNRKLAYTSLTKLIPKPNQLTDEIWKIYIDGKRVIFQSFSTIYIYENQKISIIKAPNAMLFLHQVSKRLFVEVLGKGLFELRGKTLMPLAGSEILGHTGILSILPYKENSFIIGTSKNGLFIYDGQTFRPFANAADSFLKTYQLNNGVRILDRYYAYGTILNGLIIIDEDGNIVQRINKSSGLQNNTILCLYADNEQNLWAGLDNGIDRIELNSPLYFYFDKAGQFGTVYSSVIWGNRIYLGTNQGLFSSPWLPESSNLFNSFDFKLVPNTQGQVWDLRVIGDQILCGHNDGTFVVNGNQIQKISTISGGWTIKRLLSKPDFLIQGTYTGLVIFAKDASGKWKFSHKVSGFSQPSRYVKQDGKGDIWVSHAYKGLYKLTLSADLKTATNIKYYDEKNGLPSSYNINIFNIENRILFSTDEGFFIYDEISNRFSKYEALNKKLGSFEASNKIIDAGQKKYWFICHGKMSLVDLSEPGKISVDSTQFSILDGRMVQYYENISQIGDKIYLISVDDGFVIYNTTDTENQAKIKLPLVLIRKIEDITDKYITLAENGDNDETIEVPFSRNNIRLSFSIPYYRQSKIKFQYYLEGYSKQWSDWSTATQKDFTNLGRGTYKFKVRAKINDEFISEITEYEFTILPPWYGSNWAIAFYALAGIATLIAGKRIYEAKLNKDHQLITQKLQAEKEEFLKKEAEATEKQIIKLRTEKLQAELAGKNRELANSAMSLVYKNELLQKLSQEITKLKDENGKKLSEDQLRKIQKVIDDGMNDERDWNLFESSFNEAHESFFKKLKANHPDLVPNDLKLCAYLHMNMSSKEMASLLNISLRGVEIRRYRLRKKLDVPHDKNLVEFLMEL